MKTRERKKVYFQTISNRIPRRCRPIKSCSCRLLGHWVVRWNARYIVRPLPNMGKRGAAPLFPSRSPTLAATAKSSPLGISLTDTQPVRSKAIIVHSASCARGSFCCRSANSLAAEYIRSLALIVSSPKLVRALYARCAIMRWDYCRSLRPDIFLACRSCRDRSKNSGP